VTPAPAVKFGGAEPGESGLVPRRGIVYDRAAQRPLYRASRGVSSLVEARMDRRTALTGSAAAVVAATAAPALAATNPASVAAERKTYVLVHGTWLGAWSWKHVRRLLAEQGHDVFTPTMTGCGERKHLMSRDVGLETHVLDIANLIEYEELDRVILVGHSFAGVAITGVADRMRDRIRRLVYLDALVPTGTRLSGVAKGPNGQLPDDWRKRVPKFIDGYQMDFFAEYPLEMLIPKDDIANAAWARRRITTHAARGWSDDLVLQNGGYAGLPKTYVRCTRQRYRPSSDRMVGAALDNPEWQFIEFPYPRAPMITHPAPTAELLASLG
jgi:pimeloyl-ACP methyl ester carboxylesterase